MSKIDVLNLTLEKVKDVYFDELNLFEVKNKPNMFILGEATDQVGICGGFNLWYAFTSALIVADKICK